MPKTTSTNLFELVHSLTKAEKAYFRSFAQWKSREDNPLYIKLFDAITRQKKYDEKKLVSKFNLKPNIFASLKNNLYSVLLDCLRNFHTGHDMTHKVRELLYHAEILFHKKLFPACLKILERAMNIAEEFDLHSYCLEIIQFIQLLKEAEKDIPWLEKKLPLLLEKEDEIIKKTENFKQYRKNMAASTIYGYKINLPENKVPHLFFENMVDEYILKKETQADSFWARIYYYKLKGFKYYYKNDLKNSLRCYIEMERFINENEKMKRMNVDVYNTAIHNILAVGPGILGFSDIRNYFQQLQAPEHVWLTGDIDFTARYYNNLLRIYIYYHIRDKAKKISNKVSEWLNENEKRPDKLHTSSIIYFLAHLYFFEGDFKKSLLWLNNLVNNYNEKVENYVYCSARLLILVINYELGNYEQLPYLARSTHGFLRSRQRLFKFEEKVLSFFSKKLPNASDHKQEALKAFKHLRAELAKEYTKEHSKRRILQYFDLSSWLDSKIEGKTFYDVLKRKPDFIDEKNKKLLSSEEFSRQT
jgi:hypothetical protein